MSEGVSVPGFFDDRPCKVVRHLPRHPLLDQSEGGKLSTEHDVVHLVERISRRPQAQGPGKIAGITTDLCANVDDDRFSRADLAVGWPGVGQSGVGSGL